MTVEESAIKKYKRSSWYDKKRRIVVYGVDAVMRDGKSYHCCDDNGAIFFKTIPDANKKVRECNSTLTNKTK